MKLLESPGPIGVFDSGYGGLTILHQMRQLMPQYDYLYLGDNARAPYGPRSFDIVYQFTREAVMKLFDLGCHLVIIACNTASAKALRTIQQNDLPGIDPKRRVLGVIRPTAECIGHITQSRHVGIFATVGTIKSESYVLEIQKLYPDITVTGEPCPMWVPLIENNEYDSPGADYFVEKRIGNLMRRDPKIDTIILGCTHYPLLSEIIGDVMGPGVTLVSAGEESAYELKRMLKSGDLRSEEGRTGDAEFYVSDRAEDFERIASLFLKEDLHRDARRIDIDKY